MSAIFPTAIAGTLDLLTAINNTKVTLNVDAGIGDTTLTVDDASPLPSSGYLTFDDNESNPESVYYTGKSGNNLTGVTRAADSTAAGTHATGSHLEQRWNAIYHNILVTELIAVEQNLSDRFGLDTGSHVAKFVVGSAAAPSITFSGDTDTGIYWAQANSFAFATSGLKRWAIDGNGALFADATNGGQFAAADGTVSVPGISFQADGNTGIYRIGADDLAITTNGVKRFEISTTALTSALPLAMGSNKITGLTAGATTGEALSYEQLVGVYLPLAGGTLTGNTALTTAAGATLQVTGASAVTGYGDQSVQIGLKNSNATTNNTVAIVATDSTFATPAASMEFKFTDRTNHYSEWTVITRGADGYLSRITASAAGAVLQGTITNDSAAAGKVGEAVRSAVSNVSVGSNGTWADMTSIALTAGDWDVTGIFDAEPNGATVTLAEFGITTTTGNATTGLVFGDNYIGAVTPTSASNLACTIANYRISLSAGATAYLKAFLNFSVATPKFWGRISARRIR